MTHRKSDTKGLWGGGQSITYIRLRFNSAIVSTVYVTVTLITIVTQNNGNALVDKYRLTINVFSWFIKLFVQLLDNR